MATTRNLAALALLGLAAGACAPVGSQHVLTASHNPSLYSVNQPVVQRTDYVFDLATTGDSVPASEQARLRAWFDGLGLSYGDRVAIDEGPYPGAGVARDIGAVAGQYGLLLSESAPVTAGEIRPGSVRVVVSRSTAHVPGCPNWNQPNRSGSSVLTSPNFGCAINSNLAAMIADPNDLVLGQRGSLAGSGDVATKAIRTHRNAEPTGAGGLQDASTTQGGN